MSRIIDGSGIPLTAAELHILRNLPVTQHEWDRLLGLGPSTQQTEPAALFPRGGFSHVDDALAEAYETLRFADRNQCGCLGGMLMGTYPA